MGHMWTQRKAVVCAGNHSRIRPNCWHMFNRSTIGSTSMNANTLPSGELHIAHTTTQFAKCQSIFSSSSPLITPQLISITIAPIGVTNGSTDGEKLRIIICNKTCPTVSMIGIYLRYAFVIDPVDNTLINLSNGSRLPEYLHSCSYNWNCQNLPS